MKRKWVIIIGVGVVVLIVALMLYNTPERQGKREARKIKAMGESLADEYDNAGEEAKFAGIESNMKSAGLAIHMYAQDHSGQFPNSLRELSPTYIDNESFLQHAEEDWDYSGAGLTESVPSDKIIGKSKTPSRNGEYLILRVDGQVKKTKS